MIKQEFSSRVVVGGLALMALIGGCKQDVIKNPSQPPIQPVTSGLQGSDSEASRVPKVTIQSGDQAVITEGRSLPTLTVDGKCVDYEPPCEVKPEIRPAMTLKELLARSNNPEFVLQNPPGFIVYFSEPVASDKLKFLGPCSDGNCFPFYDENLKGLGGFVVGKSIMQDYETSLRILGVNMFYGTGHHYYDMYQMDDGTMIPYTKFDFKNLNPAGFRVGELTKMDNKLIGEEVTVTDFTISLGGQKVATINLKK